jgi:2-phosphosulfolactate phosphatase
LEHTNKKTVEVCFSPTSFYLFYNRDAIVVVIDVLRATSAICTAIYHGAKQIIPVASIEEAVRYKSNGYLVAAERNGEIAEGFTIGNSPFDYMNDEIKGKTIVLSTTNGTQAIDAAKPSYKITVGSFLNLDILCEWLLEQKKDVTLLCAGWKNKFNLEDTLLAGAIAQKLVTARTFGTQCDSTLAATRLYDLAKPDIYGFLEESSHRKRLGKLHLEKDIAYCLTPNKCPVVVVMEEEGLVKANFAPTLVKQ